MPERAFMDADRQALLLAIVSLPIHPAQARYHQRYGVVWCEVCNYAVPYCKCAEQSPDAPSSDGADSGLAKRIADARAAIGGR